MRPSGDSRTWKLLTLVLAVALAVAVWKPWDTTDDTGSKLPSATPAEPAETERQPSPTPVPDPTPNPAAIACISATGWRAVTRDVTAGRESRTWIAVSPDTASGPQDQSIPSIRIVVGRLLAIGYCVPAALSDRPRDARLWRIEPDAGATPRPQPGGPTALPTPRPRQVSPLAPLTPVATGMADLFGPPAGEARWTPGWYIFAVDLGRPSDPVWFRIEVIDSRSVPDATPAAALPAP